MENLFAACRRLRHLFMQKPTTSSAAEVAISNTKGKHENGVGAFEKKVLSLSLIKEKPSAACRRLRHLFLERPTPTTAAAAKARGENEDSGGILKKMALSVPRTTEKEKASAVCRRHHHLFLQPTTAAASATPNTPGKDGDRIRKFKKELNRFELLWQNPEQKVSIRRLIRAGKFSRIDEIVQHQKQYPDIKDERFTGRLIKIYGEAKMLDHALKLFDEMPELNCPRTAVSFNALLAACFSSRNFDKLIELFRELPAKTLIDPDVISYTSAVKALCKKESFDDAVSLVEEMAARNIDPDAVTFYDLLRHLYTSGRFSEGEKVWNLMKEKKVDPDRRCYNAKLQGMMSEKLFAQGLELVKEMQQKGLKPNSFTYNSLIKAFVDEENAAEVKKWYGDSKGMESGLDGIGIDWAMVLCKMAADTKIKISPKIVKRVSDELIKKSKVEAAKQLLHSFNLPCSH